MRLEKIFGILTNYDNDIYHKDTDGHTYYGFCCGDISISPQTEPSDFYYTVFKNGEAHKFRKGDFRVIDKLFVSNLPDIDYKIHSDVVVVSAGYIVFDNEDSNITKQAISDIYDYMRKNSLYECIKLGQSGAGFDGKTITCELLTIPELIRINSGLKYFEKKPFPFIKNIQNNSIYIYTSQLYYPGFKDIDKEESDTMVQDILTIGRQVVPGDIQYKELYINNLYY